MARATRQGKDPVAPHQTITSVRDKDRGTKWAPLRPIQTRPRAQREIHRLVKADVPAKASARSFRGQAREREIRGRDHSVRGGIGVERPNDEEIPVITEEMFRRTAAGLKRRTKAKPGEKMGCPTCGGVMRYANDMVFDCHVLGERIVIPNLSGLRCGQCGEQAYDLYSSDIIDRYTSDKVMGGYECSISVVGAGKLGMYFPKDLLRTMDLMPKSKAIIKPLTRRKMVVELQPEKART